MVERREVEPLLATAEDARPLWFGNGRSTIRIDAGQTAGRLTVHEHVLPGDSSRCVRILGPPSWLG